jgi:hypothetical protein
LEIFTRRKSLNCIILSLVIGVSYQYFLNIDDYKNTVYILNLKDIRDTLIDKNKEGIFSLFGYLSIFLAGESICYRINNLLKKE